MWVFVHFDLPTTTKKERKAYTRFRKGLQQDGFSMLQYSSYTRHCNSRENAEVHKKRVINMLPPNGNVFILEITDAQFGRIMFFSGTQTSKKPETPQQLELF